VLLRHRHRESNKLCTKTHLFEHLGDGVSERTRLRQIIRIEINNCLSNLKRLIPIRAALDRLSRTIKNHSPKKERRKTRQKFAAQKSSQQFADGQRKTQFAAPSAPAAARRAQLSSAPMCPPIWPNNHRHDTFSIATSTYRYQREKKCPVCLLSPLTRKR
jgi:hypothetical protein